MCVTQSRQEHITFLTLAGGSYTADEMQPVDRCMHTAGNKSLFNNDKCAGIGKESAGAGKKAAATGELSPAGIPTGSRTPVTGKIWTAFIRTSRSSTKPVTHWILERTEQKLFSTHTSKYILFSIYYAQLNYYT